MTLFWQHFRAQFAGLLIWCGIAVGIALILTQAAPAMASSDLLYQYMESLPESLQAMLGHPRGLNPLDGFIAMELGAWGSLLLSIYAVILALGIVTREIDHGTVDFLLAMPIDRWKIVVSRVAVMALNTALLGASFWVALRVGLARQNLTGSWGHYAVMFLGFWLVAMAIGAVALLTSMWLDDYSLAVKLWLGLVAGGYFLEMVLRAANVGRWARGWSPFSYASAVDVVREGAVPLADVLILVGVAVVAVGLSIPIFQRKQIAA